jgi:hypothetical protein
MMKIFNKSITWKRKWNYVLGMLLPVLLLSSCNKDVQHVLKDSYGPSGTEYKTGKVLLLVIDGAGGKAVQKAVNTGKAPQIKSLANNSMYTYEGLADSKVELDKVDAQRGWANLMTGTTTNGVGKDINDISQLTIPSFLSLLKTEKSGVKTCFLSSNDKFIAVFGKEADEAKKLANDQAIKESTISLLAGTNGEVPDVTVVQFSGVEEAGLQSGFYDENYEPSSQVVDAISQVDTKIGSIVETLKKRPLYEKENWLVIVTSSYGGLYGTTKSTGSTFYNDLERNTFTLLFSPRLQSSLLQAPTTDQLKYNYYSPWYTGSGGTESAIVKDGTLFNMGSRSTDTKSYTIQFMIYDTWTNAGDGHSILAKRPRVGNGTGWNIRMSSGGGNVAVFLQGNSAESDWNWYQIRKGNPWRVFTYVYKECGPTDSLVCYMDGELISQRALNNNEMSTNAPLTIGKIEASSTGTNGHFYVNNVQFYDIALPPAYLAANYCKTHLDKQPGFEYWDHLLGYWPNDREEDFGGKVLPDYSKYGSVYKGINAGKSDMILINPTWESGSKLDPNVCPLPDASFYRAVFNTVDIPYQIFQWLGVGVDRSWKWDGVGRALQYKGLSE